MQSDTPMAVSALGEMRVRARPSTLFAAARRDAVDVEALEPSAAASAAAHYGSRVASVTIGGTRSGRR